MTVFDLDDTLYPERQYVASGFRAVERWLDAKGLGAGFADDARALFESGRRGDIFNTVLERRHVEVTPELVSSLVKVYRGHAPEIELAPDAGAFLAEDRDSEAVAVITDGFLIAQQNKVRALKLEALGVTPILCTDAWGRDYWKPHERAFKHLERLFDVPPSAFTYVGDNPSKDFVAPAKLGWHTVQIMRPERIHKGVETKTPAARTIASLSELDEALAAVR